MAEEQRRKDHDDSKVKREDEMRKHREAVRLQEEAIAAEQEKKRREREELMEKLKKQDDDRKKRKREEKKRKEAEKKSEQDAIDSVKRAQQIILAQKEAEVYRIKEAARKVELDAEIEDKMKERFEQNIPNLFNGTDIPCLFEKKIAYLEKLSHLPLDLESQIEISNLSEKQTRYKTVTIPFNEHLLPGEALNHVVSYFMKHSAMRQTTQDGEAFKTEKYFPFKCLSMQLTVMQPPFDKPSTNLMGQDHVYRVINMLFDTNDYTENHDITKTFSQVLKGVQLSSILPKNALENLRKSFPSFVNKLAQAYRTTGSLDDFPYDLDRSSLPVLSFKDENDSKLGFTSTTLNRICFTTECLVLKDEIPPRTLPAFELFRRQPHFYSYNPNPKKNAQHKKSSSKDLEINKDGRVRNKNNDYDFDNVCVVFKEISHGAQKGKRDQVSSCSNSLEYFME